MIGAIVAVLRMTAGAALILAAQTPGTEAPINCRLKIGVALGCVGEAGEASENAADLFSHYGLDKSRLLSPVTPAYVQRFQCLRLSDPGNTMDFHQVVATSVATEAGSVAVRLVQAKTTDPNIRPVVWVADGYFVGACPRFH